MYFPQDVLQRYVADGLLTEQRHPLDENLRIYNYTHRVQHDKSLWDDVTMNCRGLVLDIQREVVVSACLKKFWNYDQHLKNSWPIPQELPIIMNKYDGWYGALMWLNDEDAWIHTRGSFTSPGAQWATAWFRERYATMSRTEQVYWRSDETHVFEIIAPVTRIVVQYDFEGLVHLAAIDRETDVSYWPLLTPRCGSGIREVEAIDHADYRSLSALDTPNTEGFVLFFPESQVRMKIKFANYLTLHRLITGLSTHALWEMWRDGQTLSSVAESVPEEMRSWIAKQFCRFKDAVMDMDVVAQDTYLDIMCHQLTHTWGKDMTARNKAIALKFQEHGDMAPLLFQIHKQREMLWKHVEPNGSETFKRENEV